MVDGQVHWQREKRQLLPSKFSHLIIAEFGLSMHTKTKEQGTNVLQRVFTLCNFASVNFSSCKVSIIVFNLVFGTQ